MQLIRKMGNKLTIAFTLLVIVHLLLLINLRFTAWPEMLSYPYLYNNGYKLYSDFIYPYPPLLTQILASIMSVAGYSAIVLKVFSWLLFITNDLLIFKISKKVSKSDLAALGSVCLYVLLQPFLEGNMLWFDTALVTPLLAAILSSLYVFDRESKMRQHHVVLASLFFTLAIFIKQTAGLYAFVFAIFLLSKRMSLKTILYAALPPLVLGLGLIAKLLSEDTLQDFYNWTFWYPMTFWSSFPGYVQMAVKGRDLAVTIALVVLPLVPILELRHIKPKFKYLYLMVLIAVSLVAVYPRFSFFHFQPTLALICITFSYVLKQRREIVFGSVVLLAFLFYRVHWSTLRLDWGKETRFLEADVIALSEEVADYTTKDQKVLFLGVQSAVFVLADRLPPKPWADNFGWYYEVPGVQASILENWKANPPSFIISSKPKDGNWFDLASYRPKKITSWIDESYTQADTIGKDLTLWEKRN